MDNDTLQSANIRYTLIIWAPGFAFLPLGFGLFLAVMGGSKEACSFSLIKNVY